MSGYTNYTGGVKRLAEQDQTEQLKPIPHGLIKKIKRNIISKRKNVVAENPE